MPAVNPRSLRYEGIQLTASDFIAGTDNGEQLAAGEVGEIATIEVGEDGQASAYDAIRPGSPTAPDDPTQGKLFANFRDGSANDVADDVQVRLAVRDKNSNRRQPVTEFFAVRDLDNSRPDLRKALRPVTRDGSPFLVSSGRLLVLEAKRESGTTTVDITDSTVEIPAIGGF